MTLSRTGNVNFSPATPAQSRRASADCSAIARCMRWAKTAAAISPTPQTASRTAPPVSCPTAGKITEKFWRSCPKFWSWPEKRRKTRKTPEPSGVFLQKKGSAFQRSLVLALPIFTASYPATIVGVSELNFCVRDGNRWALTTINTNYSLVVSATMTSYHAFQHLSSIFYSFFKTDAKKRCKTAPLWQGQKDLNPRPTVLETAALPTELYPYMTYIKGRSLNKLVGLRGLEPGTIRL